MALSNLLTNAIRYTPQGGDIKLFVAANDAAISVGVQDTGEGINYEHIPRLTERFYRIDEGRSREVGGTGLGLSSNMFSTGTVPTCIFRANRVKAVYSAVIFDYQD